MVNSKTVSAIIPCRNEEKAITSVVKKVSRYVDEVIVVDNRSTDRTAVVAKKAGARVFKDKRAINGIGYGFAHQTGLKHAKGDWLVALDGDDTYPAFQIKKIMKFMEKNGLDFVSCNRFPLQNKRAITRIRQLGVNILNLEVLLLYQYPIKDILTGMWILKREALPKLGLKEGGWDLSPEIKLAALVNPEIRFGEYHIAHFLREGNLSKQVIWKTGWGHLIYILRRRLTTDNVLLKQVRYTLSFPQSLVQKLSFLS